MPSPSTLTATVWEDSGPTFLARIVGNDNVNITQADISSIALYVYDLTGGTTIIDNTALTVANVVFDTLQTDAIWDADSTGYNFKYEIADTTFATGDSRFLVEIIFNPASGGDFPVVFEINTKALKSS